MRQPQLQHIISRCHASRFCRDLLYMAAASGRPLYLVGGAVRDLLLRRQPDDWDFIGPQAIELAHRFADALGRPPVVLREDQPTVRVPLPDPAEDEPAYFDFCALRAPTIADDLAERDFTLNAIACDLLTPALLDPTGGLDDLQARLIRAPAERNLQSDPLRCLRAYRLAAQLGFTIQPQTRRWIARHAHGLSAAAGQRIGDELYRLLTPPHVSETLALADEDGVLAVVLPELEPGRDMPQQGYHHLPVRDHSLASTTEMEKLICDPAAALPSCRDELAQYLARSTTVPLLLISALLHDIGKPPCFSRDANGRIRFQGHPETGAQIAGRILRRWAWPAAMRNAAVALVRLHMRPLLLAQEALGSPGQPDPTERTITLSAIRRLFRLVESHPLGLVLVAMADARAAQGPAVSPDYQPRVERTLDKMARRYLDHVEEEAAEPLLTGHDLIAAGFEPGPLFSRILEAVEEACAEGQICSQEQALALARRIAGSHD